MLPEQIEVLPAFRLTLPAAHKSLLINLKLFLEPALLNFLKILMPALQPQVLRLSKPPVPNTA
jgi:hypothetical protein